MTDTKLKKITSPLETIEMGPARILPQLREAEDCPLGFGVVEFDKSSVPFELGYAEILHCLEGEISVSNKNENIKLRGGDTLYMAAHQKIYYDTPNFARLLYITHGSLPPE